jgi:hypothetical protein
MSSVSESDRGAGTDGASDGGSSNEPVLLVTLYDPVEAEIIVGKLRSAGIAAYLRHEAMSVVYGLTVDGFGRQDIMVRPEDLPEAQAALEREP